MADVEDYGDVILVKFYEEGQLLEESFFQTKTKANCLFEFIDRDDVYLENESVSISFQSSFKPLGHFFGQEKEVSLYIIPFEELQFSGLEGGATEVTDSPTSDVIVIEDSPEKESPVLTNTKNKVFQLFLEDDTSCSTNFSPSAKKKRRISSSCSSDDELPDITYPKAQLRKSSSPTTPLPAFSKKRRHLSSSSSDDDLPPAIFHSLKKLKEVDELPWDIDGESSYKLPYDKSKGQKMKTTKDGRDWQRYNKCYTKEFPRSKGIRLQAKCKGFHQCTNKSCPFQSYYGRPNTAHILKAGNDKLCEECHRKMSFTTCNAVKTWEFPNNSDFVVIHHKGTHTCFPSKKPKIPAEEIKEVIEINQSLKPCEMANRFLMRTVENSTSREEVETVAFQLSDDRQIRNLKQKLTNSQSLSTKLSELQDKCINQYDDPYLLFEYQIKEEREGTWTVINSTVKDGSVVKTVTTTNDPDKYCTYIIKSSKEKLNTMCHMMNKDHFLGEEWAFMDFKVNRVNMKGRNLKTFGISTYHTLLKKVPWLIRMDCEKEDCKTVSLGLDIVDRMLKSFSNGLYNAFVPSAGWMLDEGGGLHAALQSKFGEQYCQGNVVTCRLHLTQCTSRHAESAFAGDGEKKKKVDEFKVHVQELVHAPSITSTMKLTRSWINLSNL